MKKKLKKIEPFKNWCDRVLVMLRAEMYLKEWEWKLGFVKDDEEKNGSTTGASITIDVKYLNYSITIFPVVEKMYKEGKYMNCFEVLVHELSHIYTEPLYEFAIDAVSNMTKDHLERIREQQTQRICGCIKELVPTRKWMPKKK